MRLQKAQHRGDVFVVLAVIGIVAVAFVFLAGVFGRTTTVADTKLAEVHQTTGLIIESAIGKAVAVRNSGTTKLVLNESIALFVDNVATACSWSQFVLQPQESAVCSFTQSCSGSHIGITRGAQFTVACT